MLTPFVAIALVLTACGGSKATTVPASAPSNTGGVGGAGGGPQNPGASGEVAAMTGTTLQVQSATAQTAVTYSSSTTIRDTIAASFATLKVGVCAQARPAGSSASATAASAAPTGTPAAIVAATVVLSEPVNGRCAAAVSFGGAGAGAGAFANGPRPSTAPTGVPTDLPTNRPGAGAFGGSNRGAVGADGLITSISGSQFVIASERFARSRSTTAPSPSASTTAVTVTVSNATTYSQTVKATASVIKVGSCVTALGKADDTGAIAATTIAVRAKVNGTCAGVGRNG